MSDKERDISLLEVERSLGIRAALERIVGEDRADRILKADVDEPITLLAHELRLIVALAARNGIVREFRGDAREIEP